MIYFDNNATTPIKKEVLDAMMPYLTENYGNPSSSYKLGIQAQIAMENARKSILNSLQSPDGKIIFTSGGSEADNLAIKAVANFNKGKKNTIVTSTIEHPAVKKSCESLRKQGFNIIEIPASSSCSICPLVLEAVLKEHREDICLISIMAANNEVGTIQPIEKIGHLIEGYDIVFHVDAVQSIGWLGLPECADLVSMSGHKLNAPKGIGALYISPKFKDKFFAPNSYSGIIDGGKQEYHYRGGTENVPYIVGLAKALEISSQNRDINFSKINAIKEQLRDDIRLNIEDVQFNTPETKFCRSLPNTLNVSFAGLDGAALAAFLSEEDICVSTGSACSTGSAKPSHVLTAMGLTDSQAFASIRISLGSQNTLDEEMKFVSVLAKGVKHLRKISGYKND